MKLSEYAKQVGVTWKTANNWFHAGKIPGAYQTPSGSIFVPNNTLEQTQPKQEHTAIYARVSSHDQKEDLNRQIERLRQFSASNGWVIHKEYAEIASGLNDHRPKLTQLLTNNNTTRIIIEHKDRLTRFGHNYIKILCDKQNIKLIIINETITDKEDLKEDLTSIITNFCARIYGQRRSARIKQQITSVINNETH